MQGPSTDSITDDAVPLMESGLQTWAIGTIAAVGAACALSGLIVFIFLLRCRRSRSKPDESDEAGATVLASARSASEISGAQPAGESSEYGDVPMPSNISENGNSSVYGGVPTASNIAPLSDLPVAVDGSGNYGSSNSANYGGLELSTQTRNDFGEP